MSYKITATSDDLEKLKIFNLTVTTSVNGKHAAFSYFETLEDAQAHLRKLDWDIDEDANSLFNLGMEGPQFIGLRILGIEARIHEIKPTPQTL